MFPSLKRILKEIHPDEKPYIYLEKGNIGYYYGPYSDEKTAALAFFLYRSPEEIDKLINIANQKRMKAKDMITKSIHLLSDSAISYIKDNPNHKEMGDMIYKFLPTNRLLPKVNPEWNKFENSNFPKEWFEDIWNQRNGY